MELRFGMEQLPSAIDDKMYLIIERLLGHQVAEQFLYKPPKGARNAS